MAEIKSLAAKQEKWGRAIATLSKNYSTVSLTSLSSVCFVSGWASPTRFVARLKNRDRNKITFA